MNVYGVIYKITNKINNKIYIGKKKLNSEDFFNSKYYGSGKCIKRALLKYGKDNFTRSIIRECSSDDDLNNNEKYWINKLNSTGTYGYNIRLGGEGGSLKGRKAWNKGLKKGIDDKMKNIGIAFSKETKIKMSNSAKGKIKSDSHRKNIGISGKGRIVSDEVRKNLSMLYSGRNRERGTLKWL